MSHILSNKFYAGIFMWLIVFTGVTVGLSFVPMGGSWNIVIGLVIATFKACLVAAYFMHLKYEDRLIFACLIIPLILLFVLMGGLTPDVVFSGE